MRHYSLYLSTYYTVLTPHYVLSDTLPRLILNTTHDLLDCCFCALICSLGVNLALAFLSLGGPFPARDNGTQRQQRAMSIAV